MFLEVGVWMSNIMTSVSGVYLYYILKDESWMCNRMASVSGAYLNCILVLRSEWASEWHPCLERIYTCIWKMNLNEYQNGVRIWSVSELYLKVESEWVSEWRPYLERIWKLNEKKPVKDCFSWSCRWLSWLISGINLWPFINCWW